MEYTRNCPKCQKILYSSTLGNHTLAIKKNSLCRSCSAKQVAQLPHRVKQLEELNAKQKGKNNPFYGKKHKEETIAKLKLSHKNYKPTEATKIKLSHATKGSKNPMFGKKVYDVWVEKYGLEEADRKLLELKAKQSKNSSGSNNPMYGKPAPKGSGNGWKGWYKEHFFRSLRELSYLIYLDDNQIPWESGEKSKFSIDFIFLGKSRTYQPDYFINNNTLVECKPKKLFNTPLVQAKKIAAENFCKHHNWTYQIIDVPIADITVIQKGIENNMIVFMPKYMEKFLNYVKTH